MTEVVNSLLRRCLGPTQMMIANLVKIELAYVNTSHPDFIGGSQAVAKLMERMGKDQKTRKQVIQTVGIGAMNTSTPLSPSSAHNYNSYEDANENEPPLDASSTNNGGIMSMIFNRDGEKGKSGKGVPSEVHLPQVPDTMNTADVPSTDRERVEMEVIKYLIDSYFSIVRKNFIDMVPKTIMYFLVNHVRDSLQNELVSELYRDAEMGVLLQEAEDIATRRQTCNEMRSLLGKALEIVNEVRDFNAFK
jgi:dynamin 1-like protein